MSMQSRPDREQSIPFDIWRTSGTTEHLGGIFATQRLLADLRIAPGQRVLDIGCGTGFSACYLARQHRARVTAVDISPAGVAQAARRVSREQVSDRVTLLRADAHDLPCAAEAFDAVIMESVLTFCRAEVVAREAYRVLKSGGLLGANELALVGAPPPGLPALLAETLGLQAFSPADWRRLYQRAGFSTIVSTARRMSYLEQLASHLRVDGVIGYCRAAANALAEKDIRRAFINRDMLRAGWQFSRYIGYHLYVGRK